MATSVDIHTHNYPCLSDHREIPLGYKKQRLSFSTFQKAISKCLKGHKVEHVAREYKILRPWLETRVHIVRCCLLATQSLRRHKRKEIMTTCDIESKIERICENFNYEHINTLYEVLFTLDDFKKILRKCEFTEDNGHPLNNMLASLQKRS